MAPPEIAIRVNMATADEISSHLTRCSGNYFPPLVTRVNISDYSLKIRSNAITFEAMSGGKLEGLVAAYFNDDAGREGFITNVSVTEQFTGRGIATVLLRECIRYASENNVERISLEVSEESTVALRLYERIGFNRSEEKEGVVTMFLEIKANSF